MRVDYIFLTLLLVCGAISITLPMANAHTSGVTVDSFQKISEIHGNFLPLLDDGDKFGHTVANLGDLDGDGVDDFVIGADQDDDGGPDRGATYILFMSNEGIVKSYQKISSTQGGFLGPLNNGDHFGHGTANLGDLDSDGVTDIAVGAYLDNDGGSDRGAVWILFSGLERLMK